MLSKIRKYLIVLLGLFMLIPGCKNNQNTIPEVLVDIQVNINNPGYFSLQAIGGWMYLSGGSRGIIVYRKSTNEFMAWERHCPFQPEDACGQVSVDSSNVFAVDYCCGSKFLITDGSIVNGPATLGLKMYQTSYDGFAILRIYN
jgi:nitrite reductase/ring-hydroxylating ferredoxin subunit